MRASLAAVAALLLTIVPASAQPTTGRFWNTPAGVGEVTGGTVLLGLGADSVAYPCGHPSVVYGCDGPRRAAPSGGNVAVGLTATTIIPAASMAGVNRGGWQAQGTGYGCASWVTASIAISANAGSATCTGAGAFLFTAGSAETIAGSAIPNTALTAVEASGANLVIVWQVQ